MAGSGGDHLKTERMKNTGSLTLLLLASFVCRCQTQEIKWPVHSHYDRGYNSAPIHQGYAVTKNGDTARGYIKLLLFGKAYHVLDTATNEIRGLYYQIVAHHPRHPLHKNKIIYRDGLVRAQW